MLFYRCPVAGVFPTNFIVDSGNKKIIETGLFPAPKFADSDYLFLHCAVRVCVDEQECHPVSNVKTTIALPFSFNAYLQYYNSLILPLQKDCGGARKRRAIDHGTGSVVVGHVDQRILENPEFKQAVVAIPMNKFAGAPSLNAQRNANENMGDILERMLADETRKGLCFYWKLGISGILGIHIFAGMLNCSFVKSTSSLSGAKYYCNRIYSRFNRRNLSNRRQCLHGSSDTSNLAGGVPAVGLCTAGVFCRTSRRSSERLSQQRPCLR